MTEAHRRSAGAARALRGSAVLVLTVGTLAAATTAVLLAARTAELARPGGGAWRVETAVELGVAGVGAVVAAWLAVSAGVALLCSLARLAGATWRTGERVVHRWAPAVVRRALVLAVGAGVGLAGATTATATAPVPPEAPVVASTAAPIDLGWAPTTPAVAGAVATATPVGSAAPEGSATPEPPDARTPDTAAATEPSSTAAPLPTRPEAPTTTPSRAGSTPAAATPDGRHDTPPGAVTSAPETPPASAGPTTAPTTAPGTTPGRTLGVARDAHPADAGAPEPGPDVAPPSPTAGAPSAPVAGTVVVQPGDTLWAIAARHLPAGADDATVARAWPQWYAANAGVVGADPDVLLPGQVLTVPATDGTDGR